MTASADDSRFLLRAIDLAARGQGFVEPNPMVGCVIVRDGRVVGRGWHQKFGGPHAEIEALRVAGDAARGATAYVSLEPCCHHGKTPPCTDALIAAGVTRVVAAMRDPFPRVAGGGFERLTAAGIAVEYGLHEAEAVELNAPYLKLLTTGRPWVIAKWAMTLDGKLATRSGDSKWISNEGSRAIVHELRSRVDAILVGRGTAIADDPLLTARRQASDPPSRIATRIVLDSLCELPLTSKLVQDAAEAPVMIATSSVAPPARVQQLRDAGCEVLHLPSADANGRLDELLTELGRRRMTNMLVEGGSEVLGSLLDSSNIDEVHAFIAPKLIGGAAATSPLGGRGRDLMADAVKLIKPRIQTNDGDIYVSGRLKPSHHV